MRNCIFLSADVLLCRLLAYIGLATIALAGSSREARAENFNSMVRDDMEYYMQTDKSVYSLGEDVEMLFRVTNLGEESVTIGCSRGGEFNFWVQTNEEHIWAAAHFFKWFSPGVELFAGTSRNVPYNWNMRDDDDDLIEPGIYNVVGVMYNEPWNRSHSGEYTITEVGVPISIIPEPTSLALFMLGLPVLYLFCKPTPRRAMD